MLQMAGLIREIVLIKKNKLSTFVLYFCLKVDLGMR